MCGICGIRRFGEEPIEARHVNMLLMMNERRGNQATGLAIQNTDGVVHVYKTDDPAGSVVASKPYRDFLDRNLGDETRIVIGHTRMATQGDPRKNENNHPVFAGKTAIVHNGCLNNDFPLFNSLSLERKAQVDSDIIRAILDKDGLTPAGAKALSKLAGSAAIAAMSNDHPGTLLLARSGSPLIMAATGGDLMVFSSEKPAIHTAMRPYIKKFGTYFQQQRPDISFLTMPNDSVYLFNEKGMFWHDGFTTTRSYTAPNYRVHDTYSGTRNRWNYEDEIEGVVCPNEKCKNYILLTTEQKGQNLWDLFCRKCKTPLANKPKGIPA